MDGDAKTIRLHGRRAPDPLRGPQALAGMALALAVAGGLILAPSAKIEMHGFGFLTLALFIPVLCALSVLLKSQHVAHRRDMTIETDHFADTCYYKAYRRERRPDILEQTWFPILVTSLINLYFARLLIYSPKDLGAGSYGNFLLLADRFGSIGGELDAVLTQGLSAMCFAYLGWYVWTVATIFSRLVTMELVPATYYGVLTRLLVAVFVALVFQHLKILAGADDSRLTAEAVGFGVGLFPDAALASLQSVLRKVLLRSSDERLEAFPLDLIQGVSPFRKLRLGELGMDNCANLAAANAVTLFLDSSLKLAEVLDWIGQAQLLVLVGQNKFITLQASGYRTALDLHRGAAGAAKGVIADLLAYKPEQLADLACGMDDDPSFLRLKDLHDRMVKEARSVAGAAPLLSQQMEPALQLPAPA